MNPFALYTVDGKKPVSFVCGKCRRIHTEEGFAEHCCSVGQCEECGAGTTSYYIKLCRDCRNTLFIRDAEKIFDWGGPVYLEGIGGEFFSNLQELLEELEAEGIGEDGWPEYVFLCTAEGLSATEIFEGILSEIEDYHFIEDRRSLCGTNDLAEAIEKFVNDNVDIETFQPDFKRATKLGKSK